MGISASIGEFPDFITHNQNFIDVEKRKDAVEPANFTVIIILFGENTVKGM